MEDSTDEYRKGLGKRESFLLSSLARKDKKVFTADDAREVLSGNPSGVMHSLIRKKWVLPMKKGLYARSSKGKSAGTSMTLGGFSN